MSDAQGTVTVHGQCARVIDVPSQGISYLRIEIPVEQHAEATRMFYGRPVLLVLAGGALAGQPFGLLTAGTAEPGPPKATPKTPTVRAAPKAYTGPPGGPLSKDAARVCDEPAFQAFASAYGEHGLPPLDPPEPAPDGYGAEDAATFMREFCGVLSRAELDHQPTATARFRQLMAEYRHAYRDGAAS